MLTKNELKQLRKEIVLNSVFIKDYSNSLGIDENKVCTFFEGYAEYLNELALSSKDYKIGYYERITKYDTINNLWNYYNIFIDDPLKRGAENE